MQRNVASNLMWMLTERGVQISVGIGVVAMLARGLGPEGFAHFQYAQAVVYIASSIALLCSGEVVVPRLVASPDPMAQHRLVVHAFGLRLTAGMLAYLLMCCFLIATHQTIEFWLPSLILGIAILLREPSGIVTTWMQAHTRTRPNALFNMMSLGVKASIVGLLLALSVHSAPTYATAFAAEAVVMACLLGGFYLARAPRMRVEYDAPLARELLRNGLLFWVSFMLMMGSRRIDQLLLKPLVPLSELGAYAASMQILDNFVMVATILAAGLAPIYVYAQPTPTAARRNILKIAAGMTAIGATGALLIAVSAHWIIHLLYGAAFASAVNLLRLAALASTLIFADVALTLLPIFLRRPSVIALKWGIAFTVTVIIDVIAIPRLGVEGAVLGYAVANLFSVLFGITVWVRGRSQQPAMEKARA
jgi:PST family polysaccharide transporter